MRLLTGTSGFSYKEWKGSFYPEDLPADKMLVYYSERLPTVEINNTFYRMPKPELLTGWCEQVPESFRFILKASQRITHRKRLKDAAEEVDWFYRVAAALGERAGPTLFQLPPNLKKDLPRLQDFLAVLPERKPAAFEFRHASWFEDDVFEALRSRGAALCIAEDEDLATPLVATAGWGYLRLRRQDYDEAAVAHWASKIRSQAWADAYAFFKHEDAGSGPRLAAALKERFAAAV
ncbi:MAG TPA: DUF72 domain-containing protein [Thermoanaerobaculia bacterium]|jgi:uncharacterized protein YecE (DUF72 family)|nr:DUF72 domain-containing protein [Thermoanaerobaculia bacterium]